ncbi:MAG: aminotransferase class III-fold pyridoxal phosphate-dependent enzyme, partial [Pseudomonadota bacterium]
GVLISDRVAGPVMERAGEFFHGYTYSGHPAACAAGLANLRILREERLVERVDEDIGPYLQAAWARLAEHPLVGEARMTGLVGAAEIVRDKANRERFLAGFAAGNRCRDHAVGHGLVMRAVGDTMIISPPLIISREECDLLVQHAWAAFDRLAADASAEGLVA